MYEYPGHFYHLKTENVHYWLANVEKYMQLLKIHEDLYSVMSLYANAF